MKSWIAAALIIVPLLLAAAITYWPHARVVVSSVVILPSQVHGTGKAADLADKIPLTLAAHLKDI